MAEAAQDITVNIRAPGDKKLTVTTNTGKSVLELKQQIAQLDVFKDDPCEPATQRLIFSGRVLKDGDTISNYKVGSGNTIHLVRSAKKPDPPPAAAQVPENLNAGQQFANNPLAPLMNAGGPSLAGFNPFADMGVNPSDPNYLQNMMQSPQVQSQMEGMLSNPQVIDQIIASSPELQAMGPQARSIMQSPMFRQMLMNPDTMRTMMELQGGRGGGPGGLGGMPGMGAGGSGGGAQPGLFGLAQQQAQQNAFGGGPGAGAGAGDASGAAASPGASAGQQPPNPLAGLFGGGSPFGGGGGGAGGMGGFGGMGGMGGFNAPAAQPADGRSPEERYETQLQTLRDMGMHNTAQNVRALMATGGNVEAAIEYIFSGGLQ